MAEALFQTAPKEVLDYFDRRPSVPTFDWRDLAAREHALAYTVAKTAGADVLKDLRAAVRVAIEQRQTFDEFRAGLEPLLKAKGWWGVRPQRDDVSGAVRDVQLGSPRRLQTIYWANTASAHAAGEWERTQRNKAFLPYLVYQASVSERKRPLHLSWVGTALPVDDPWWASHYPPNGWNCKCSARQVSPYEYETRPGLQKTAPPVVTEPWKNRRTGEVEQIPRGVDPGWQHNPGDTRERTVSRQLASALDRMPEPARRAATDQLREHPVFDFVRQNGPGFDPAAPRSDAANRSKGHTRAVVAAVPKAIGEALGAETRTVLFSVADAAKQLAKRGASVTAEDYANVQGILDAPDVVAPSRGKLLVFKTIGSRVWVAVLKTSSDGRDVFLNSFRRAQPAELAAAQSRKIGGE